jgi:RimJ/RimL family protein N-acetyltransferase
MKSDLNIFELSRVSGPNLSLRLITPDDAEYIHDLRSNPQYNRFLSQVVGEVEGQRQWIEAYKHREEAGLEFYYIIERMDGVRCGTVRLYEVEEDSFTWGSWILDASKPKKAALESAVLSFGVAFELLSLRLARIDVATQNEHAAKFYRRFGMTESHRTDSQIFFEYASKQFHLEKERLCQLFDRQV